MKTFYRLESKDGRGIYSEEFRPLLQDKYSMRYSTPERPCIAHDKPLKKNLEKVYPGHDVTGWLFMAYGFQHRFGFDSLAKLTSWFTEEMLKDFIALGAKIIKVENVPDEKIVTGRAQDLIEHTYYTEAQRTEMSLDDLKAAMQFSAEVISMTV